MKIGVIGLGYWGPNLVRNLLATDGVENVVCFDLQSTKRSAIKQKFPGVEIASSYEEIFSRPDVGAVAIVTPVSSHYSLGMQAINAGKHILIEKPLAASVKEARELVNCARSRSLVLMVDHTFIYTGAVRKIRQIINQGDLGEILYFDSVRVNLGLFQHDVNVIWDLAPHDVSIMTYLIEKRPISVSAVGVTHFDGVEDMAYLTVHFPDNLLAHFHVNWLSPVKVRKILIGGSKHMIVYDDVEPSEKVKVYNKGVDLNGEESVYSALVQYRIGDMYAPQVDQTEALSLLTKEFIDSINQGTSPISDGQLGLKVVEILEAAERSLRSRGAPMDLFENSVGQ